MMTSAVDTRPLVFMSASHDDRSWRDRITARLDAHAVAWWDDSKIPTGRAWQERIDAAIENARLAIVLLSPNYLSSNTAVLELEKLLSRRPPLILFPIVVTRCPWQQFARLRSVQIWGAAKPIDELSDRDADAELDKIASSARARSAEVSEDACDASTRTDPTLEYCLSRVFAKGASVIDRACTPPRGERPSCLPDGALWTNLVGLGGIGNVPVKYCNSPSGAFVE
jgi:hypothetical protein